MIQKKIGELTAQEIATLPTFAPPALLWTMGQAKTHDAFELICVLTEDVMGWKAKANIGGVERKAPLWKMRDGKICATFTGLRDMNTAKVAVVLRETVT